MTSERNVLLLLFLSSLFYPYEKALEFLIDNMNHCDDRLDQARHSILEAFFSQVIDSRRYTFSQSVSKAVVLISIKMSSSESSDDEEIISSTQTSSTTGSPNVCVSPPPLDKCSSSKKNFRTELMLMMHSLGDDKNPFKETVTILEDLVCQYILSVTDQACSLVDVLSLLSTDHILHVVRNDAKKYARVQELLTVNEELKKARKAFDFNIESLSG